MIGGQPRQRALAAEALPHRSPRRRGYSSALFDSTVRGWGGTQAGLPRRSFSICPPCQEPRQR
jgi:hypothetical protein